MGRDLCPHCFFKPSRLGVPQLRFKDSQYKSILKVLNAFCILFWLLVCSASHCFPLFVTYCRPGDLFFSSFLRSEPQAKKKGGRMSMETELALTVSSSTFFSVHRGNLYNLVQNVDIVLNKC